MYMYPTLPCYVSAARAPQPRAASVRRARRRAGAARAASATQGCRAQRPPRRTRGHGQQVSGSWQGRRTTTLSARFAERQAGARRERGAARLDDGLQVGQAAEVGPLKAPRHRPRGRRQQARRVQLGRQRGLRGRVLRQQEQRPRARVACAAPRRAGWSACGRARPGRALLPVRCWTCPEGSFAHAANLQHCAACALHVTEQRRALWCLAGLLHGHAVSACAAACPPHAARSKHGRLGGVLSTLTSQGHSASTNIHPLRACGLPPEAVDCPWAAEGLVSGRPALAHAGARGAGGLRAGMKERL